MKMTWIVPRAVLRMDAQTPEDLDTISTLAKAVLAGASRIYGRPDAGDPLHGVQNGQRSFIRAGTQGALLMGLEWDIRNQPNAGTPKSDADVRMANPAQPFESNYNRVTVYAKAGAA